MCIVMNRAVNFSILIVAIALQLSFSSSASWAQRNNFRSGGIQLDSPGVLVVFRPIVALANQSTVSVICNGRDAALGTIVGPDGWIITKYSELREPIVCQLPDKRRLSAQVVGQDPHFDLAMLKVDASDLKPVDWSEDETGPMVGQILATTNARSDSPKAIGVCSVPRMRIPLTPGRLGVKFDNDQEDAKIGTVDPGSAAAKAGLQAGDLVERINEVAIDSRETMINTIHKYRPGDHVTMLVRRGDDELNVEATLVADNSNRSDVMDAMGKTRSDRRSDFPLVIQHDSYLNAVDCGGPLVDLNSKVVGVNIAAAGRTESYAVPADKVRSLLFDMEHGKLAPKFPVPGQIVKKTDEKSGGADGASGKPVPAGSSAAVEQPDVSKP
jgi:serine protease Do